MNKFYYLHIAPIICLLFGHKWDGECYSFLGDYDIGIRRFNYGRKGGKRRPQIYRKRSKKVFKYCSRCGKVMTKNERRKRFGRFGPLPGNKPI